MFKDEEYAFDEESERARLLKPVMSAKKTKRRAEDDSDEDETEDREKEEEAVLPNELFEKEKATKSDSDSMASESEERGCLEENVSISKRVKNVKNSEVIHVKGKFLV